MAAPGAPAVREALSRAFSNIEKELRSQLLEAYRHHVDERFTTFMMRVNDPTVTGRISDFGGRTRPYSDWYQWVKIDRDEQAKAGMPPGSPISFWEQLRSRPQMAKKDYAAADRDAAMAYETARDSFIEKNVAKITTVLSGRSDFQTIYSDFAFRRGVFEGNVVVTMKNEDTFTARVGLKYVVRYIPRITPYYQYPLLFSSAKVGGKIYRGPSEDELRIAFGGASKEKFEEAKKVQAAAEGWCPGSGQYYKSGGREVGRYKQCHVCKQLVSVSSTGKILKHKTQDGEKAAATKKAAESGYCAASRTKVPADIIQAMGPVEPYKDPKALCRECGQMVRLDADKDWIPVLGGGYPTHQRVKSATYYKHKLPV